MIDRFMHRFWNDDVMRWNSNRTFPAVNISEDDDAFHVDLAAPGLEKKDFKVSVDNGYLTIAASKEQKHEESNGNYKRVEFNYKDFRRTFTLPDEISQEAITSKYENGVLMLTLPKKDEAKPRPVKQIAVN